MQWLPGVSLLLLAWIVHRISKAESHITEHLDRQTHHLQGVIMSEAQDAVDAVTAELGKLVDRGFGATAQAAAIAALQDRLWPTSPAPKPDLTPDVEPPADPAA